MKRLNNAVVSLGMLIVAAALLLAQGSPRLATVTPDTAKAGDTVSTEGENLEKAKVSELYLTDGKADVKMEIVEQAATSIKFKLPASVKPGRFNLMVLTATTPAAFLEQPVKITVQ